MFGRRDGGFGTFELKVDGRGLANAARAVRLLVPEGFKEIIFWQCSAWQKQVQFENDRL
jgi:hypothetical protein